MVMLAAVVAITIAWVATRDARRDAPSPIAGAAALPPASYVGAEACAACHPKENAAWAKSQHARAMQPATDATMPPGFDGARVAPHGVPTRFAKRDGAFVVTTEGRDGKPVDVVAKYVFGLEPLQQLLVDGGDGRLQAFGVAWDTRPKAAGGQRWFDLHPERRVRPGDPLHWTGIDQTWNYQCADCHSTNLRKNYDATTRKYATTWTDVAVGCEACHGPASNHVAWAAKAPAERAPLAGKGLAAVLDERRGAAWAVDAASGNAQRNKPRETRREIDTCGRCHARRGQFSDTWHAGQPLADGFRPSLLAPGLYHPDGQQLDEVFNYGSFLQSRMHAKGVTCSDCHDPHSQKLKADGNAVCAQCHSPAKYDARSHTHHAAGTPGAQCVDCHMPATTYMVIDPRRDHSFRIPRPDRTLSMGVPNACNDCHRGRDATWSAARIAGWFPQPKRGFQTFAETFHAADRGAPGSRETLAAIAQDRAQPGIVRASALERLRRAPHPSSIQAIRAGVADPDELVRSAAAQAAEVFDAGARARLLAPLLADPVRLVRMDAARTLAGDSEAELAPADRERFERALAEYVEAQRFDADRPEGLASLGALAAVRGDRVAAEAAYRRAMDLDPSFLPAALNLADLMRARGEEEDALRTLRATIARNPDAAAARHALGLALVRTGKRGEALGELATAQRLAPDDARYAYVLGVALNDAGRRAEALRVLRASVARHPYDRDTLEALATYERAAGDAASADARVAVLLQLDPRAPGMPTIRGGAPR